MKKSKLIITSAILSPLAITPVFLTTSCSVYTDLINNFKPSYKPYEAKASLTEAEANQEWFGFIADSAKLSTEIAGAGNSLTKTEWYYYYFEEQVIAKSTFTSFLVHIDYANIDKNTHKLSFKYRGEVDGHLNYLYDSETVATANEHYSFDIEVKNMEFYVFWEKTFYAESPTWVFAPKVCYEKPSTWTSSLTGDEMISFNNRYVSEVYNMENQQHYSVQTTEGGVISESSPLTIDLSWLINSLVVMRSYYLSKTQQTA